MNTGTGTVNRRPHLDSKRFLEKPATVLQKDRSQLVSLAIREKNNFCKSSSMQFIAPISKDTTQYAYAISLSVLSYEYNCLPNVYNSHLCHFILPSI